MVEKTDRTAGPGGPRSADGRRFEVFVREAEADPLRHVGTVAAPTPDAAHEEASELFARYARDVWVCPAEETHRYSAESLAGDDRESGDSAAAGGDASPGGDAEPRVYEETEGTPTVACGGAPVEDGEPESTDRDDAPAPEDDR
ncbi:Htur_1727 family rSAM-partnered candidate RiPP [Halorubrum sp. SD626R]|jgi:rSAM-partnered protein|uniref:Htur_1727 family rSAM-partnered candidate RiPP n=1 Tax=Halorubrum sp. SD626R TaxID=1419722 RepID=UPI000B8151EA|nr:Htur_1727 family rSAM-partnered candidate RiPP [Halorubrum sp. SD626R]TKX81156.1 rSAM-partnered protein [Halorubrum sp. SD626R]